MATAKKAASKRVQEPLRVRAMRDDSSIETAISTIEQTFNLPPGSVKLVYKGSGHAARRNSTIENLRANWAD